MFTFLLISIFIVGYLFIAFEHSIKIDKAATALVTGVLCWTIFTFMPSTENENLTTSLSHHFGGISEILFFLLGAMTIVELIDAHDGFQLISSRIKTTKKVTLLWTICFIAFFLSAVLDNLTTTIVMVSLCRKLMNEQKDRWFFAGMIVIAANAGGAWSPIGDVTTTMLWIGGQISALGIITGIVIPSLICLLIPLSVLSFTLKGSIEKPRHDSESAVTSSSFERNSVFILGVLGLLFVPVFKTITHLPPYMGILLSLGVLWVYTEIIHRKKNTEERSQLSVVSVIRKIDAPSILFFLGILLAVSALESADILTSLASSLNGQLSDSRTVAIIIGALSAVVDNVPLVAASIGMFQIEATTTIPSAFQQDGIFWQLLAFSSGTGGSMLIIGSAAGVAAMGLEKISFGWYLKHISWLAAIGFIGGCVWFMI